MVYSPVGTQLDKNEDKMFFSPSLTDLTERKERGNCCVDDISIG